MRIVELTSSCKIEGLTDFNLGQTLDSGQCFRYTPTREGFFVIAGAQRAFFAQEEGVLFSSATKEMLESFWIPYFDLNRDYGQIKRLLSKDEIMSKACCFGAGVRVLHQDFFETLITFIISQQNNIPRIKKIVSALCEHFGACCICCGESYHAFPTPERLASLTLKDFEPLNMGYRAPYIIDAATQCIHGEIIPERIQTMPYLEAKSRLKTIKGVGDKVANCVLLFGAGHIDAFPIDVWIQRGIDELYNGALHTEIFSPYGGIAQQYLFYYMRRK